MPLVWCAVGAHKTPRPPKAPNPLLAGVFRRPHVSQRTTAAGSGGRAMANRGFCDRCHSTGARTPLVVG